MTTETALQRTSAVDPEVAAAIRIHDRLVPIKDALGLSDFNDEEVSLFAMVAQRSGLDPFARQIYMIRRKGKATFQTGIDGYRSTAARTREYAGSDEATFEEPCPCGEKPAGHPSVARVVVHRVRADGVAFNQTGVARWHELKPDAGQDLQWQKMPFNQLSKCAEANGLRKAFPTVLADIYITEEMEQAGPGENAKLVEAAAKPKAEDRIAARRAAIEASAGEVVDATGQPIVDDGEPDLFEGMDAPPTTAPQDEVAAAPAPDGDRDAASTPASSALVGYPLFRARYLASDQDTRPNEQAVRAAAKRHEKAIPDIGFKPVKDWPLLDGDWAALGDALGLPEVQ